MNTVIFDMDGVLVDSEYSFFAAKSRILHENGIDVSEDYHYPFMGTTGEFMWQKIKQDFPSLPLPAADYITQMNDYREQIIKKNGVRAVSGAENLLKRLSMADFKIGLASGSRKNEVEHNLAELGWTQYFDQWVSAEEVAHSKPAPDVFLRAADLLHSDPADCLVFEDTKNGSQAAKAAGMYCIGFANPQYPLQDLGAADQVIDDFSLVDLKNIKTNFN